LLVCNWPHSVGQNHFFVNMLFIRDSAIQKCSRRFCTVSKSENSVPCQPSGRRVIPSGRLAVQCINRPDAHHTKASSVRRCGFPSEPSSMSRSFELLQLASVRTFQQPIRMTLSVRQSFRFSFQNQIWEDCRNRPDDVDSRPDASLPWSRRAYDRYGNCV
jgi:hypothetical protein